ncbi:MAG: tRNA (adenosine(37)-N6)-dimethylallyltransferase MiaA [Arachnia propionica]|nr:MAG: tRNA (adenosine(37)-N6)-dimethylallyltransferase MiaA [Arachnia propionica]
MSLPVVVLVGPTATGKSELAVQLCRALIAEGFVAEIVNADSMLIYRSMDIGTAKPTLAERDGIVHHLVDVAEITHTASVAEFQGWARAAIAEVRAKGGIPVLVGGSALYTRAIVDQFEFPGADAALRAAWEAELARVGAAELHRRLAEIAPESAARIEPGNGRRIVRALEVAELTGQHRPELPQWTYALDGVQQYGLQLERGELDARIEQRVERMWEAGLVEEVRRLESLGLRDTLTASRAIGYRQVLDYLAGDSTEEEAKTAVKRATKRFFRKQLAWYRRDPRISWLPAGNPDNVATIVAHVTRAVRK